MIIIKKIMFLSLVILSTALMSSTSSSDSVHPDYNKTGNITASEFKAQLGLIAWLDDFDFDAKCTVDSYTLYYTARRKDPVMLNARGGTFKGMMNRVIKQAASGDQYTFTNVKVKCPGDVVGRPANSLYFKIR
ncbi:MAG: Unknown protein [uncultured Aureispira sp.]|uniref:Gliding motility-associated protein GldM C-terminal domain-containing protein n=1 Tax=uncultured Aureispira sp. TaxID=1331704 RepID=A0A6S6UKQ5_9BACT|nr:MAG: Unknown protein [uncultured Aureispira sp.]